MLTLFKALSTAIFLSVSLYAIEKGSEDDLAKKIYAHVEIHDPYTGSKEAEQALRIYPNSRLLHEAYLVSLSKEGHEKKMSQVWQSYKKKFPDPYKRDVLESMAWGTLRASSQAYSPLIRLLSVLGAFYGQDAEGVEILNKCLKDPHSIVRTAAVQMSSKLRDAKLCSGIIKLLQQEKNWNVRLEVIKAAGEMKLSEAKLFLTEILVDDHAIEEERAASMKSLVKIYEKASKEELDRFSHSQRAGMRSLACQIIEHLDLDSEDDVLFSLLKDGHSEVRCSALHAIGSLERINKNNDQYKSLCLNCLQDSHPEVAIMAAWALLPVYPFQASEIFKKFIVDQEAELALMAAGALSATGRCGIELSYSMFNKTQDTYVKLNLAIGLIQQCQYVDECCLFLYNSIMSKQEKWMWDEEGYFKVIAPSSIKYEDFIPNYPEAVNQMTRLEVLNILAIKKFPGTQTAIRHCLQQKTIGVSSIASALLLTEGDESSIDLVENLLNDPDQKINLQAALVLAIWGGSEKALNTLYKAYDTSDRSIKEKILESLARIGEASSIPFLVEKLQEPYPSLRIIAAVSLLACLNH